MALIRKSILLTSRGLIQSSDILIAMYWPFLPNKKWFSLIFSFPPVHAPSCLGTFFSMTKPGWSIYLHLSFLLEYLSKILKKVETSDYDRCIWTHTSMCVCVCVMCELKLSMHLCFHWDIELSINLLYININIFWGELDFSGMFMFLVIDM